VLVRDPAGLPLVVELVELLAVANPAERDHGDPVRDTDDDQHHAEPDHDTLDRRVGWHVDRGDERQHAQHHEVEQHRHEPGQRLRGRVGRGLLQEPAAVAVDHLAVDEH
jgi:hypothetical protein